MEKEIRNEIVWVNALDRKPDHCAPVMIVYIDIIASTRKPILMENFAFYLDGTFMIQGSNRSLEHYPVLYWADIPQSPKISEDEIYSVLEAIRKNRKKRKKDESPNFLK